MADTYEDMESEGADPVHRAFCRIKIFRDKVRERRGVGVGVVTDR